MSEQAPKSHEQAETLLPQGEIEKLLEAHAEKSKETLTHDAHVEAEKQRAIAESAREVAVTAERDDPLARLEAHESQSKDAAPAPPPDKFLQKQTLKRELKSIQRKESAPARTLSKVVHQPTVQAVSEVAGKTVTRPSGILGGGLVALIGTSVYLYLAYHVGFTYQPTVFLLLLVVGFGLGLAGELLVRLVLRSKQPSN